MKVKPLSDGNIAFIFSAKVDPDGTLFNATKASKPLTSAREYESIDVRYWDTYYGCERSTLFYTILEPQTGGTYDLSSNNVDALKDTGIEFPSLPVAPLGEAGNYDVSISGIVFEARDPEVNLAEDVKQILLYIPLKTFAEQDASVHRVEGPGFNGSARSAAISKDGKYVVFAQAEALKKPVGNDKLFIGTLSAVVSGDKDAVRQLKLTTGGAEEWDRVPGSLLWSNDGKVLYMTAEDSARTKLFVLELVHGPSPTASLDCALTKNGTVAAIHSTTDLANDRNVLITYNSIVDSSVYALINTSEPSCPPKIISDLSQHSAALGLCRSQISEFYAPGDDEKYKVHCWVLKPSFFKEGVQYPLFFAIHGGPQGAWSDAWSTRWNYAVIAEQGYVVLLPNPTGSTGFGFDYTNRIGGEWGGSCYRDLVSCYEYAEKNLSFVDFDRAIAGGGSFGGYMTNYIAGQPLGQKFKGLISHDGVFSTVNMMSSDIPTELPNDIGAPLWEDPELWNKYAPSTYTKGWSVPMLVIHSDGDYRCPITEGLAAYNVCQMKGIPSRFLNFPDENHFVMKRENSLQWMRSVLGWANYWAKNEELHGNVKLQEPLTRKAWKKRKIGGIRKTETPAASGDAIVPLLEACRM